jgi:hypothetical protein
MFIASQLGLLLSTLTRSSTQQAFIYTDPGSGTLVWQLLLAAFFGVAFYFRRFKEALLRRKRDKQEVEAAEEERSELTA